MNDIEITYFVAGVDKIPATNLSFLNSLQYQVKNFNYLDYTILGIIQKGHLEIGVISFKHIAEKVFINITQSPKICRLSIISLIESAVYLLKFLELDCSEIIFNNVFYAHYFKLKSIFNLHDEKLDTQSSSTIYISSDLLKNIDIDKISNRDIIIRKCQ